MEGTQKRCPVCAMDVPVQAQACGHCGRYVWPDSPLGQELARRDSRNDWLYAIAVGAIVLLGIAVYLYLIP